MAVVLERCWLPALHLELVNGSRLGHGERLRSSRASSRFCVLSFCRLCEYGFLTRSSNVVLTESTSPESPRWLVHEGHFNDARTVVATTNANGDVSDPVVVTIYKEIVDTLEWEKKEGRTMSPKEIYKTPVARKRLLIGMSPGPFSCIAGNIIASYYLGSELDTAGVTNSNDQLKAVSFLLPTTVRPIADLAERRLKCMVPRMLPHRHPYGRKVGPQADCTSV